MYLHINLKMQINVDIRNMMKAS